MDFSSPGFGLFVIGGISIAIAVVGLLIVLCFERDFFPTALFFAFWIMLAGGGAIVGGIVVDGQVADDHQATIDLGQQHYSGFSGVDTPHNQVTFKGNGCEKVFVLQKSGREWSVFLRRNANTLKHVSSTDMNHYLATCDGSSIV